MVLRIILLLSTFIACKSDLIDYFSNDIVCRNQITGEPVDWFTLYKLPKKQNNVYKSKSSFKNPYINQGTAYVHMSSKDIEWQLSDLSINDSLSFPGRTLDLLYSTNFSNTSSIGYILYNDQADKVTVSMGHTKGVIIFNQHTAIWIVHSIPHFPSKPSEQKYFIRPSQCVFGQSMLCMSFKFDQLETIGKQMLYNYPQIYDFFIPEILKSSESKILNNLLNVLKGEHVKQEPWTSLNLLTTINGESMLSFSKFTDFQDDLYSGLVAPSLKSNLFTETWNNGAGTLKSNCSAGTQFNVLNIQYLNMDIAGLKFSVHNDHSKWAVTFGEENFPKVACVGDINRQLDQLKRAGGTVCFKDNEKVWSQYYKLILDVEKCEHLCDHFKTRFEFNQFEIIIFLLLINFLMLNIAYFVFKCYFN